MRIKKAETRFDKCIAFLKGTLSSLFGERRSRFVFKGVMILLGIVFIISAILWRNDIYRHVVMPIGYKIGMTAQAEKIIIDVNHKNYQRLAYKREMAIRKGILLSSAEDYVPAEIRHKGVTYPAKIRLKGDDKDHWSDKKKWSFRIKLKGDKTLFSMKQFSIQHPHTRGYFVEWLFHQLLDYSGLIHLDYNFIEVVLNGKSLGLYAIEEHFDKILIEKNKYREGPIIRFNDDLYWIYRARDQQEEIDFQEAFWLGSIDVFHPKRIKEKEHLFEQYKKAKDILEAFRRGSLEPGKVFNLDQLALFFAVLDLWGDSHPNEYHNMRFYYNPVTTLLEPIGYDASNMGDLTYLAGASSLHERKKDWWTWETELFKDEQFFTKYIKALEKVSEKEFLDEFFKSIASDYEETLNILYAQYPAYTFNDKQVLYKKQKEIQKVLNPPAGLQAYLKGIDVNNNSINIYIGNIQSMPIEISGISINQGNRIQPFKKGVLSGKIPSQPVDYQIFRFPLDGVARIQDLKNQNVSLHYEILGTDKNRVANVFPWELLNKQSLAMNILRKEPNHTSFQFIQVDEKSKKIFIQPGKWTLKRNLILPEGYEIIAPEGLTFNMIQHAKILSYSPLRFIAGKDSPIIFKSDDSTGQGLAVIDAKKTSYLWNVRFENLAAPQHQGGMFLGAVNFYQSSVDIRGCLFTKNRDSDDSLNIIRSDFLLDNSSFEINYSDALDIDFSKGKISNSSFIASGMRIGNGDAIDISGSHVEMDNVRIKGANDKGISVGERSNLIGSNISILNARIGVASKDLSQVQLNNIELTNIRYGLSAYQKKPEFGPSSIEAKNITKKNIKQLHLIEEGSTLKLNGKEVDAAPFDYSKL